MFETARRLRRSARVARTGAAIYLGYKRTQRRARRLPPGQAEVAWLARHQAAAETLYRLATDLRGLYIKSGQFIGTRTDLLPEPYTRSLSRLQDAVPPHPFEVVRRTIEAEFDAPSATSLAASNPSRSPRHRSPRSTAPPSLAAAPSSSRSSTPKSPASSGSTSATSKPSSASSPASNRPSISARSSKKSPARSRSNSISNAKPK